MRSLMKRRRPGVDGRTAVDASSARTCRFPGTHMVVGSCRHWRRTFCARSTFSVLEVRDWVICGCCRSVNVGEVGLVEPVSVGAPCLLAW